VSEVTAISGTGGVDSLTARHDHRARHDHCAGGVGGGGSCRWSAGWRRGGLGGRRVPRPSPVRSAHPPWSLRARHCRLQPAPAVAWTTASGSDSVV